MAILCGFPYATAQSWQQNPMTFLCHCLLRGQKNILDFLGEAFFDDWDAQPGSGRDSRLFQPGLFGFFWAGNDCRRPGRRQKNKTTKGFIFCYYYLYVCVYKYIYIYIKYVCVYIYIYECIYMYIYIYIFYVYLCVHVCVCVCDMCAFLWFAYTNYSYIHIIHLDLWLYLQTCWNIATWGDMGR